MKQFIIVESTSSSPPYKGTIKTYDVYSSYELTHTKEVHFETGSILRQTALRVTACIPSTGSMLKFKGDTDREWHETFIDSYKEIAAGHAQVVIRTPYTD